VIRKQDKHIVDMQ